MNTTINRKRYILMAVVTILISILCIFITTRLLSEIERLSEEVISSRNTLFLLENSETELKRIQSIYDQYKSDIERINTAFFNISVPVELVSFLEETASSSNVSLNIDSITKGASKNATTTMNDIIVRASGTAPFGNIMKLLVRLENSPFLLDILDLTVRQNLKKDTEKSGNVNQVTIHFSFRVFTK